MPKLGKKIQRNEDAESARAALEPMARRGLRSGYPSNVMRKWRQDEDSRQRGVCESSCMRLLSLEEENGAVSKVKVDEVLGLCSTLDVPEPSAQDVKHTMGDEASKVPAYNAVPGSALAVVELDKGHWVRSG
jgi:hypothetical protein